MNSTSFRPRTPQRIFDRVAHRYELVNCLLSLGCDSRWRRFAATQLELLPDACVIDLACGTGQMGLSVARQWPQTRRLVGCDINQTMLAVARKNISRFSIPVEFVFQRAEQLSFSDAEFDGAIVGFAIDDFEDRDAAAREILRVLKPNAWFVVLELSKPRNALFASIYRMYLGIFPIVDRLLGRAGYAHLRREIQTYRGKNSVEDLLVSIGFENYSLNFLTGGIATVHRRESQVLRGTTIRNKVLIVGAGPAGLTAAIVASKLGFDVQVYERADRFRPIGGGIALQSNGLRVLESLGILAELRPQLRLCQRVRVEDHRGSVLLESDASRLKIPHNHTAIVMRNVLQEHLLQHALKVGAKIEFGCQCISACIEKGKGKLYLSSGQCESAFVVIAADGIHSAIRKSLGIATVSIPSHRAYLRGISFAQSTDTLREIWGLGGMRFGTSPLPDDSTYFYCSVQPGTWNAIRDCNLREWIATWSRCSDAQHVLEEVKDWSRVSYDEPNEIRVARWNEGPFFLIGDAAHAQTPDLGQGANSAMVDALVLPQLIAMSPDVCQHENTGEEFQRIRGRFVRRIQRAASQLGWLASFEFLPAIYCRNFALRSTRWLKEASRSTALLAAGYNPLENRFFF